MSLGVSRKHISTNPTHRPSATSLPYHLALPIHTLGLTAEDIHLSFSSSGNDTDTHLQAATGAHATYSTDHFPSFSQSGHPLYRTSNLLQSIWFQKVRIIEDRVTRRFAGMIVMRGARDRRMGVGGFLTEAKLYERKKGDYPHVTTSYTHLVLILSLCCTLTPLQTCTVAR